MAVELNGMTELINTLQRLGHNVTDVEEKALEAGAEIIQEEVITNVPERTGNLKDNIKVTEVKDSKIEVHTGKAYYGLFLEYGTSKMQPKPFMEPSFHNVKAEVENKMAEVIRRELNL
jgi:HK97 gp10 family phage protein